MIDKKFEEVKLRPSGGFRFPSLGKVLDDRMLADDLPPSSVEWLLARGLAEEVTTEKATAGRITPSEEVP